MPWVRKLGIVHRTAHLYMKDDQGVVYFISQAGLIKIGQKDIFRNRLSKLKKQYPGRLHVIGTIPTHTPQVLERQLHREFAPHRIRREWFLLTVEQVAEAFRKHGGKLAR